MKDEKTPGTKFDVPLCKDCDKCKGGICFVERFDPVTGEMGMADSDCITARKDPFSCGVDARHFTPKQVMTLYLTVDNGHLFIKAGDNGIGTIDAGGKCQILSTATAIKNYTKWQEAGGLVDDSRVRWRKGNYCLGDGVLTRSDCLVGGCIYDFDTCQPIAHCRDANIIRHSNGTPVLF